MNTLYTIFKINAVRHPVHALPIAMFAGLVLFFSLPFQDGNAYGQPVFKKQDASAFITGTTVSLPHNLTAITGDHLYLLVGISVRSRSVSGTLTPGEESPSVQYDGTDMMFLGSDINQNNAKTYIFGLASPDRTNPSAAVSVVFDDVLDNGSNNAVIGAMTFSNVNQDNPYNTFISSSGSSTTTTLSLSVASPANTVVFSVVATDEKSITSPGSGDFWNITPSSGKIRGAGKTEPASGNPTNVSWTTGNQNKAWSLAGISLNPMPIADLQVTKTSSDLTPYAGETITFTITARNNGPDAAPGVEVTDLLPAGFTYSGHTAAPGTTYSAGSGLWLIGTLTASQEVQLTITVTVNPSGTYTNTASVAGIVVDGTAGNNAASVTITLCQAGGSKPLFD